MKAEDRKLKNQIRRLERAGYALKHTDVIGWWVDGCYGYALTNYWSTKRQAVADALRRIWQAQTLDLSNQPCWLFSHRIRKFD